MPSPTDIAERLPSTHHGSFLFSAGLVLCRALALPAAALCVLDAWIFGAPLITVLKVCRGGAIRGVYRIWFAKFAQKLADFFCVAGWERPVVRAVELNGLALPEGGCVIATCHTPWDRFLARAIAAREVALVFGAERWARHAGAMHVRCDRHGLRRIARHLRGGGRVVMMVDVFGCGGECQVQLLGRRVHALPTAARLAGLAGVPLVPVTSHCARGRIVVDVGEAIASGRQLSEQTAATRQTIAVLDRAIRRDPGTWNDILRFARRPPNDVRLAQR